MVLIERVYGARPRFTYYIGTSQGGREALTVAQRYPADYDGIAANVPIVGFSSLMLGARTDPHSGEAARQLGDAGQGQRDSWRVHAPVRQPRRTRRRRDQQLHGVPRAIRRDRRAGTLGREALPGRRRSESRRHERGRVPDRRADLRRSRSSTAATGSRRRSRNGGPVVRDVGAEHRPVRQRADCWPTGSGDRKAPRRTRRFTRILVCSASRAF